MANVVGLARDVFPAESRESRKVKKGSCGLKMDELPQTRVLVDVDKLTNLGDQKRPDFLFFSEGRRAGLDQSEGWAISIEIKKGSPKVSDAIKQIQGGARIIEEKIGADNVDHLRACLVSGCFHKGDRDRLKLARVTFAGRTETISPLKCENSLNEVLT